MAFAEGLERFLQQLGEPLEGHQSAVRLEEQPPTFMVRKALEAREKGDSSVQVSVRGYNDYRGDYYGNYYGNYYDGYAPYAYAPYGYAPVARVAPVTAEAPVNW